MSDVARPTDEAGPTSERPGRASEAAPPIDASRAADRVNRGLGGGCGCAVEQAPPESLTLTLVLGALPGIMIVVRRRSKPLS